MIKKGLLLTFLCFNYLLFSQENSETEIKGQIIVEANDIEGITIYNKSMSNGAVSNSNGEFNLKVKLNDTVEVRAIQYQDFNVIINEAIITSKKMKIYLIEEINQLEEIVLRNNNLSGNLKKDASSIKTFKPHYEAIYFGVEKNSPSESPPEFTRPDIAITNITSQNKPLIHGLNLVNVVDQLLIPLFRSEIKNKKELGLPEVPAKAIKYFFGSEFISDNFGVPKYRIEEFIRFVEQENFDINLLNYGKELELLELINTKSKLFLETEVKKTE